MIASISKHDVAGIVCAVAAVVILVFGGIRLAAKAAMAMLVLGAGVVAAILAVLFFTRTF